jgi:hypothetical protein
MTVEGLVSWYLYYGEYCCVYYAQERDWRTEREKGQHCMDEEATRSTVLNASRRMDAGAVRMERRNVVIYREHNKSSLLPVKPKTRRNIYIVCLNALLILI